MEFRKRFRMLLGIAMFVTGAACLVWAVVRGHGGAWSAAAMCFCASGVCLGPRKELGEE